MYPLSLKPDYFGHNIEMKKLSVSKLIGFLVGSVHSIPKELRQLTQIMIFVVSNYQIFVSN